MSHELHVLPDACHNAAQNMAHDFLLLNRYQPSAAIRLRHYEWVRPAYTFGMSQSYSYAESEALDPSVELCRRPTGGGVVSHLEDWTYSLVVPATHPLSRERPAELYKRIHECIVAALTDQGVDVVLNTEMPKNASPGVCFNKPEIHDVVLRNLPTKVAGAAQKRSKPGYLMQGSIWKPVLAKLEWNRFYNHFIEEIAKLANAEVHFKPWPDWLPDEEEQVIEQFDSDAWNKRR